MPKTPAPDPVSAAAEIAARSDAVNSSLLELEPLRSWFAGLLELKARVGVALRWDELRNQLVIAAETAIKTKTAVVGKKTRRLSKTELEVLTRYVRKPVSINTMQRVMRDYHRETAEKLAAVRGAGRDGAPAR